MKRTTFSVLLILFVAGASGALAQSPTPKPAPTPSVDGTAPAAAGEDRRGAMRERLKTLTPEERQKLLADRRAALNDPEVKAAGEDRRARRRAMMKAMIKADPAIQPILEKMGGGGKNREDRIF